MELVLGGYAIAVATAILPMMAHHAAANNYEGLKKTLTFAVRIVAYITVPAAMGLMILREPIIRVLFQHGQFVAESTRLTARPLLYYAIGLPALACVKLIVPAFYSARDTKTPVIVASISFVLNIVLNVIFLRIPVPAVSERRAGFGHGAGHFLRLLHAVHHLPLALRLAGHAGYFALHQQDFAVLGDHGRGLYDCQSLREERCCRAPFPSN